MEEKELKTSPKQRFWIILIAVIMLGSILASYIIAIVVTGSSSGSTATSDSSEITDEKLAEYLEKYETLVAEFKETTATDFNEFIQYKSYIKAYNETEANGIAVETEDLKIGTGKEITDGDTDYLAYYVGWCADEEVFDSSFDDYTDPTGFAGILDPSVGLIEGWTLGVEGMKIEGIRIMTIPGSLAYGDTTEICGGTNKPLKFMVMLKAKEEPLASLATELDEAYTRLLYAEYGIDYDAMISE